VIDIRETIIIDDQLEISLSVDREDLVIENNGAVYMLTKEELGKLITSLKYLYAHMPVDDRSADAGKTI